MIPSKEFLGEISREKYTIFRDYIETETDQIKLYRTRYLPQKAFATICIIHGFAEHSGRYAHVADHFAALGYEVFMVDLRGFGLSGGPRILAEFR